jgi:CBS domain-containing protein
MMNHHGEQRVPRLPLRNRRTIGGGDGEESIASTVYCPVQGRSVAIADCEGCERFRALHFEPASRSTSVVCRCEAAAPSPAEEARLRDAVGGPVDPETPLADTMTKEVVCVRRDVGLQEVKELLMEHEISGVPVVDERGKLIGMISRADVLRAEHDRGDTGEVERLTARPTERADPGLGPGYHIVEPAQLTAGDIMSPLVLALHEGSSIGQAASLMAFEGIHRLPVISDGGEVVGILSSLDVLRWFGRRCGYLIPVRSTRRQG